jgi:gamma-glutamyltranspeptidase/glutathione hydrolase
MKKTHSNNEMDDFSQPHRRNAFGFAPSPANFIAPQKRPLSSITPLIAEHLSNGTLFLATGAAGGSRIISATAQVAWRMLTSSSSSSGKGGLGLREAVAERRVHHQLVPDVARVEEGLDAGLVGDLQGKGHAVEWMAPGLSAVQGVRRLADGRFEAVGEVRQVNSGGFTV